jgi:hypothetical protein
MGWFDVLLGCILPVITEMATYRKGVNYNSI